MSSYQCVMCGSIISVTIKIKFFVCAVAIGLTIPMATSCPGTGVLAGLSNAMRDSIKELKARGYAVIDAKVSFVLAWRPREEDKEIAVCLANLVLDKRKDKSENDKELLR